MFFSVFFAITLCLCAESKGSCWSVASAGSSGPRVHTALSGGITGMRGQSLFAYLVEVIGSVFVD